MKRGVIIAFLVAILLTSFVSAELSQQPSKVYCYSCQKDGVNVHFSSTELKSYTAFCDASVEITVNQLILSDCQKLSNYVSPEEITSLFPESTKPGIIEQAKTLLDKPQTKTSSTTAVASVRGYFAKIIAGLQKGVLEGRYRKTRTTAVAAVRGTEVICKIASINIYNNFLCNSFQKSG